ncbi:hypothetical protein S40293_06679 [Stachybotrys chartarum IBT 40293]|nr:hypothetical protein S40293_06679 [Stachybotrys chartarum IBT 40293]
MPTARYLSAASFPSSIQTGPPTPSQITMSKDATLNALVQLGAARLGCNRAFLSLIDRQHQFIVAEMTRTHSLFEQASAPNDHLSFGVCKLDICWGVCPTTMKAFMDETGEWIQLGPNVIANSTRYIINDFRTDEAWKDLPFVKGYPNLVSYVEVPLVSPLGYLLGSYCILDDKLQNFDNEGTINVMREITSAIMSHLELRRMEQTRHRSHQLIKGLGEFIGQGSLVPQPHRPKQRLGDDAHAASIKESAIIDRSPESESLINPESIVSPGSSTTRPSQENSEFSSNQSQAATTPCESADCSDRCNLQTPLSTPPFPSEQDPFEAAGFEDGASAAEDGRSPASRLRSTGFTGSSDVKSTFFRAASTIRRSMNMDGVVFLDAVPSAFISRSDQSVLPGDRLAFGDEPPGPFCATITRSLTDRKDETSSTPSEIRLPEPVLQRFMRRFPRGHVFSADEFGPIESGYGVGKPLKANRLFQQESSRLRDDITTLFKTLPLARYVVFLPLWHFQRECWYAAALGWVSDPTQALDLTDINLFSAFGNSLMAEVSLSEAMAANQAKSNFVSTISHELRSPLHGILASNELLRGAVADAALLSTIDMIDSCGTTLLDTFNNLLDHAKISNANKSSASSGEEIRLVNLGEMVEDVVEAVKTSYSSETAFHSSMQRKGLYSAEAVDGENGSPKQPVLVVLSIDTKLNWRMSVNVGAWKRIIMNIFGNALKYTTSGHIEISLGLHQRADNTGTPCDYIRFSVEDTGLGMSSDFLKYQLFTPYSQENTHFPGIGLGLSIVQQLVASLQGTVNVRSSVGAGTCVEVFVPLPIEDLPGDSDLQPTPTANEPGSGHFSQGRTVCLLATGVPESPLDQRRNINTDMPIRTALIWKCLKNNARGTNGLDVVVATQDQPTPDADVYLLDTSTMDTLSGRHFTTSSKPLIMLCPGVGPSSCLGQEAIRKHPFHLHHPVGPKKLISVLSRIFTTTKGTLSLSNMDHQATRERRYTPSTKPDIAARDYNSIQSNILPSHLREAVEILGDTTLRNGSPVPEAKLSEGSAPSVALPSRPQHVLIVDDNAINTKLLTMVVQKLNHSFATACNGFQAVQCFRSALSQHNPFTTIFMDVSMPVMNGFEATRQIRQVEKDLGMVGCRIVVLTGLSNEQSRKEAFASGTDLFLTKPVSLAKVRTLLSTELSQSGESGKT